MTGVTSCLIILDLFDLVNIKEADKVIGCMSIATYELEPCPSWLIQTTRERTELERFQMPLREGGTPRALNLANLDNYHPITISPFWGKILEEVVEVQ